MNKIIEMKNNAKMKFTLFMATMVIGMSNVNTSMAVKSNTEIIDEFIIFAADWIKAIGGVVAFVGGVMFALGWQREDSEGKTRGLQTMMAGFMVVAIAMGYEMFMQ